MSLHSTDFLPQKLDRIREPIDEAIPLVSNLIYTIVGIVVLLCFVLPTFGGQYAVAGEYILDLNPWADVLSLIDPYLWAAVGVGGVIALSVIGAAWFAQFLAFHLLANGVFFLTGASSLLAQASWELVFVFRPSRPSNWLRTKHTFLCVWKNIITNFCFVRIIFCEALAIYGVILSIVLATKYSWFETYDAAGGVAKKQSSMVVSASGYFCFFAGMLVGFGNIACGYVKERSLLSVTNVLLENNSVSLGIVGSSCAIADAADPSLFVRILVVEIFASALGIFSIIVGIVVQAKASFAPS